MHGSILKNVDDNNGVHWGIDSGRNVMREKTSDKDCDDVQFLPVEEREIAVQTEKVIVWIARNMTDQPTETTLSKSMTEEVTTEVMRASFSEVSTQIRFEVSTKHSSGYVPLTPSVESTAAFSTEFAQRSTWEEKVATTTKKTVTVEQGTVMLEPWTGKDFE